jgi:hypothetical protein
MLARLNYDAIAHAYPATAKKESLRRRHAIAGMRSNDDWRSQPAGTGADCC